MIKLIITINIISALMGNNVGVATNQNQIQFLDGTGYYEETGNLETGNIYFLKD